MAPATNHLAFNPDPWIWRRLRRSKALHAIRDDEWLPLFSVRTACGLKKTFPEGGDYASGRRCSHCETEVARQRKESPMSKASRVSRGSG